MYLMRIRDFDEQSIDVAFCPIGWLCKFISIIAPCHKKVLTTIARQRAGGAGWCAFGWGLLMYGKKLRSVLLFAFVVEKIWWIWKNMVYLHFVLK